MHETLVGFVEAVAEHEGWLLTGAIVAVAAWLASIFRRVKNLALRVREAASQPFEGPSVPRATFLESWYLLEKIVSEAAQRTGCQVTSPGRCAAELHRHGIITEDHLRVHDKLRRCADQLLHGDRSLVTGDETRRMVMAALDLTREVYSRSLVATQTPPSPVPRTSGVQFEAE